MKTDKIKVAITGSTGLIGSRIIELLKKKFIFIPLLEQEFNIIDQNQVCKRLKNTDFDIFLHLAAYTNVDGADIEKKRAFQINVQGTKNVFEAVDQKKKKFIYISTDFVFDGLNPPYFEDSRPNPLSYYGQTKYQGEQIVQKKGMIIRLSYPYRAFFAPKKDFVRGIISCLRQGKKLAMVEDSLITPTFIDDITHAIGYLLNNYSPDIFHIVGADSLSPYGAGKLIAKIFHLDESLIQPTTYQDYFKNKAKRPRYSEIKSKKNNFYKMKTFEEGLTKIKN